MAYDFKTSEKIVGVFVILCLSALVFIGVYMFKNKKSVILRYYYWSYYDHARGLGPNMKVLYKGMEIGQTTGYRWVPSKDRFLLQFYVYRKYVRFMRTDTVAELSESIIGNGNLLILKGSETNSIITSSRIWSSDDEEGKSIISVKEARLLPPQRIDQIVVSINDLIDGLKAKDDGLVPTLTKLLNTINEIAEMAKTPEEKNEIGKMMLNISGLLAKLNNEKRIKNIMISIEGTLHELEQVARNLKSSKLLGGGKKKYIDRGSTIDKTDSYNEYR